MEKTMTDAKRVTELEKRKKQLEKSTSKGYFVFLIAMLALIYIVDELTSNISSSIQPEVITDFFVMRQGIDFNIGLSNLALMSLPANIIILILPFYKALADRLGRRLFLFINTIGMGMGLLICMVAPSIYVYIVGLLVIKFFIPNDVQVMYIMECAPEQHRAKLCSIPCAFTRCSRCRRCSCSFHWSAARRNKHCKPCTMPALAQWRTARWGPAS